MLYMHYVVACPDGYTAGEKAKKCFPCPENQYGQSCAYRCYCSENER